MNKSVTLALVLGFAVAAGAGGFWYGSRQAKPTVGTSASGGTPGGQANSNSAAKGTAGSAATGAVSVEAVTVAKAAMAQGLTAVGSLRSDESITLRPEVAGRLSAILFLEGQRVVKGSPLIKLDPAIPMAELEQAKANLKLAKAKYDRAVELQQRGFISGQAKDEAENNLKVAAAVVALSEAKLAKTTINAPFSGVIGLRVVSLGDYVKEGADLVNLEAIDPLKLDFRVPEVYMREVKVGQSLQVTLDALPNKTFEGKVLAVNPLVDAGGRSVVIRATVRNSDTSLRPGMFARVRLVTQKLKTLSSCRSRRWFPKARKNLFSALATAR